MPEGTLCSAHTTAPFPPNSSSAPPTAAVIQSRFEGGPPLPRDLDQRSSITPASMNRAPAMRRGGSVSTANLMARYVDPQIV